MTPTGNVDAWLDNLWSTVHWDFPEGDHFGVVPAEMIYSYSSGLEALREPIEFDGRWVRAADLVHVDDWTGVKIHRALREDRIDVWEAVRNDSSTSFLEFLAEDWLYDFDPDFEYNRNNAEFGFPSLDGDSLWDRVFRDLARAESADKDIIVRDLMKSIPGGDSRNWESLYWSHYSENHTAFSLIVLGRIHTLREQTIAPEAAVLRALESHESAEDFPGGAEFLSSIPTDIDRWRYWQEYLFLYFVLLGRSTSSEGRSRITKEFQKVRSCFHGGRYRENLDSFWDWLWD